MVATDRDARGLEDIGRIRSRLEIVRWPGHEGMRATLPDRFPTWEPFWDDPISDEERG